MLTQAPVSDHGSELRQIILGTADRDDLSSKGSAFPSETSHLTPNDTQCDRKNTHTQVVYYAQPKKVVMVESACQTTASKDKQESIVPVKAMAKQQAVK